MKSKSMKRQNIRLGVNIDHAATLRQVRGGTTNYPNMETIMNHAIMGGAEQITIHLREDRRHIQVSDVELLSRVCPVDLNLEMAVTETMQRFALKFRPQWVCLVPEKRQELTTEGGLNVQKAKKSIGPMLEKFQRIGIESSMFIGPDLKQVRASYEVGADAVEFHTGHWVLLNKKDKKREWDRLVEAAEYAHSLKLNVHAGHGLDYMHAHAITQLPHLREVNIGHSIICYSLTDGLKKVVQNFKKILKED